MDTEGSDEIDGVLRPWIISDRAPEPPGIMSILCLRYIKHQLWLLPLVTSSWLLLSFCTSYGISVALNHTEPNFPYISHTAIEPPERCIFGQMVNIGALMLGLNVVLRYLFVKKFLMCRQDTFPHTSRWYLVNLVGLVFGFLSAFGLSMVANFQTEIQRGPHYTGAALAFGFGTIYCWIQTSLTYKIRHQIMNEHLLLLLQFINSIVMSIMMVMFGVSKAIYKTRLDRGEGSKWDILRGVYLTSTVTEWLLAISILTFTLTYIPDFKCLQINDPPIEIDKSLKPPESKPDIELSEIRTEVGNQSTISDSNSNTKISPHNGVLHSTECARQNDIMTSHTADDVTVDESNESDEIAKSGQDDGTG